MLKSMLLCSMLSLMSFAIFAEEKAGEKESKKETGQHEDKDEKVALKDLPKAVVDAVKGAQPGGTITEADKETGKDGTVVYEVDVTNGGKKFEVKVDAAGKVLSNKIDDEDEKDDKKDAKKEVKK